MSTGFDWGDNSNWSSNSKEPRVSDLVEMLDLSDGEWHRTRLVGAAVVHKIHWITILSPKTKRVARIPKPCLAFDPLVDGGESGVTCPYCNDLENRASITVYNNVIDRDEQDAMPERPKPHTKSESKKRAGLGGEYYFRDPKGKSKSKTPMRVLQVSSGFGAKIGELTSLNKRTLKSGDKKAFPPQHPTKGFDINIKYSKDAAAANKYSVQKDENSSLTEDELDYLMWDIPLHKPQSLKEATEECKRLIKMVCDEKGNLLNDSGEDEGKKKKRNRFSDDFDEDLEDDDAPKSKKKSRRDDDDEDDEPPTKKKKSRSFDEDYDEADEPPRKKKKPSRDEDEDDEPAPRKKKSRSFDEDDDEDEKPVKKKKKKPADDDEWDD